MQWSLPFLWSWRPKFDLLIIDSPLLLWSSWSSCSQHKKSLDHHILPTEINCQSWALSKWICEGCLFPGGFVVCGDIFSGYCRRLPFHSEGEVGCKKRKKGVHVSACPSSTVRLDPLHIFLVAEAISQGLKFWGWIGNWRYYDLRKMLHTIAANWNDDSLLPEQFLWIVALQSQGGGKRNFGVLPT